jgi:Acyl-CoA reductase (LuxC)
MKLEQRIHILVELGRELASDSQPLKEARHKAFEANSWFLPEFIENALQNIINEFLQPEKLGPWVKNYSLREDLKTSKTVGLVMAGNIPLVGFQDFLCIWVSGHKQLIKLSSKDEVLMKYISDVIYQIHPPAEQMIGFADILRKCDAYIATGSNNSARYFEQYFSRYPHIIRRNRTSVAILDGSETSNDLLSLADDIQLYFGLGCRNVTKIYVPQNYDFVNLLEALRKYDFLVEGHKYKNNYDYNLALQIMNNRYYMTNGSILLVEDASPFSPIGQLNYEFYTDKNLLKQSLNGNGSNSYAEKIQCILGKENIPFGKAQKPSLDDYADGVDTMDFLMNL